MKTNHKRGYKDSGSFRDPSMSALHTAGEGSHFRAHSIPNDFCCGHHGAARAKSGAKKYLRNMIRKEGKRITRQELEAVQELFA